MRFLIMLAATFACFPSAAALLLLNADAEVETSARTVEGLIQTTSSRSTGLPGSVFTQSQIAWGTPEDGLNRTYSDANIFYTGSGYQGLTRANLFNDVDINPSSPVATAFEPDIQASASLKLRFRVREENELMRFLAVFDTGGSERFAGLKFFLKDLSTNTVLGRADTEDANAYPYREEFVLKKGREYLLRADWLTRNAGDDKNQVDIDFYTQVAVPTPATPALLLLGVLGLWLRRTAQP